jgi:hypothetical protein
VNKNVTVPLTLLDDIFRLLDHLDDRYDRNARHFIKHRYNSRPSHDNALCDLWIKIKKLQDHITDTYLLNIADITEDERHELKHWIKCGYSVFSNPYYIYDQSGQPMDFINGCRDNSNIYAKHSIFCKTTELYDECCDNDSDMPF